MRVTRVEQIDTTVAVYNFEVAGSHSYYVTALNVLVHNGCGQEIGKAAIRTQAKNLVEQMLMTGAKNGATGKRIMKDGILSMKIRKPTVVVLDNAPVHTARKVQCRIPCWQRRDLFLFYLPRYSPHLNIAETLWRMLKYLWLRPQDYSSFEELRYASSLALADVGSSLCINFSQFNDG